MVDPRAKGPSVQWAVPLPLLSLLIGWKQHSGPAHCTFGPLDLATTSQYGETIGSTLSYLGPVVHGLLKFE